MNVITAKQMMKATIGGENKEEINKEIEKMNKGNGSVSQQEMRDYLLKEPTIEFRNAEVVYKKRKDMEEEYDEDDECSYPEEQETSVHDKPIDFYDEYARQFGGMLIKLIEEKPHLAKSPDWLLTSKKELILEDHMENWLTVFSAKWAEGAARYALNKPY